MIDVKQEVLSAKEAIRPYIRETPVDYSFFLSTVADCQPFLKLENLQHTGSFKVRGAINKLLALDPSETKRGIIAASTGNHGLAVAYGLKKLGLNGSIFLPETASAQKVQMLRQYKEMRKQVEIIGCLPKNSPVMYDSIKAGSIADSTALPTLSDGTAGGIETDSVTFEPCRKYVDEWILVSEEEIRQSIKLIFEHHRYVVEGAAAVVVASFLKIKERLKGKTVALVICGGNIDLSTFKEIVF